MHDHPRFAVTVRRQDRRPFRMVRGGTGRTSPVVLALLVACAASAVILGWPVGSVVQALPTPETVQH